MEAAAGVASKGAIRSKITYDGSSDSDKGGEGEGRGGEGRGEGGQSSLASKAMPASGRLTAGWEHEKQDTSRYFFHTDAVDG
jgi:hypothetical protein